MACGRCFHHRSRDVETREQGSEGARERSKDGRLRALRMSNAGLTQLWFSQADSDVVGSMTRRTCTTLLAGKPPWRACSRTISSLGAM